MTTPLMAEITTLDIDAIVAAEGCIAIFADENGRLDKAGRRVNRLTRGAVDRFVASEAFEKLKAGEAGMLGWPGGMKAEVVAIVKLPRRAKPGPARKAGAAQGQGGLHL